MRTVTEFISIVEPILDKYVDALKEANNVMQEELSNIPGEMTEEEAKLLMTLMESKVKPLQE